MASGEGEVEGGEEGKGLLVHCCRAEGTFPWLSLVLLNENGQVVKFDLDCACTPLIRVGHSHC